MQDVKKSDNLSAVKMLDMRKSELKIYILYFAKMQQHNMKYRHTNLKLYSNTFDKTKKIKSQKHVRRVDLQHDSERLTVNSSHGEVVTKTVTG